jgi:hypothetical protein
MALHFVVMITRRIVMRVSERDYSTYRVGDDVTRLAGGVVAELAGTLGMPLDGPNVEQLGQLVGAIGPDKVLRNNPDLKLREALPVAQAADIVEQSGIQKPLNRAFLHPDMEMPLDEPIVMTGAVANWQDRTAQLVAGLAPTRVFLPIGNREMKSESELRNPNIQNYMQWDQLHPYPTESKYAKSYVERVLNDAGHKTELMPMDTSDGQEILDRFAASHRDLSYGRLTVARVANAGVQLAYQMRTAARKEMKAFDVEVGAPQLYIVTDTLPLAQTEDELKDPVHFQSPYTAMRQLALTAKLLAQAGYEDRR